MEPYWKVRALCYFFSLDIIGEKETLIRRIEEVLFNNYLLKKNPDDALKETADMSLEYFLKNTKFAGKRSKGPSLKELEALLKDGSSRVSQKAPRIFLRSRRSCPTTGPGSASSKSRSTTVDCLTPRCRGRLLADPEPSRS